MPDGSEDTSNDPSTDDDGTDPGEAQEPTAPPPTPTPQPTPTPEAIPCNWADFIRDVTVKDDTVFSPGDNFIKTWRLKNIGTCTWTSDYDLVYVSGDYMSGAKVISMPGTVPPGYYIDISVDLIAPAEIGSYKGFWQLRDEQGNVFGFGDETNRSFWVKIEVEDPTPCNAIKFVSDVTVKDNAVFTPDVDFTKTWRIKNVGLCTWTYDYDLVFLSGDHMGGSKVVPMPGIVPPGYSIKLSVDLTSPHKAGDYRGYWKLRDEDGSLFGIGDEADISFWVDIQVVEPSENYAFDFALNYCAADWSSETRSSLPCPSSSSSDDGFALLLQNAELENRSENEPTLWVHPNKEKNGWIDGIYPLFEVQDGDRFKGWVGCFDDQKNCNLTFRLDYLTKSGKVKNLGEWSEIYDGEVTIIDMDLSDLAGDEVRFILSTSMNNKDGEDAHGF